MLLSGRTQIIALEEYKISQSYWCWQIIVAL